MKKTKSSYVSGSGGAKQQGAVVTEHSAYSVDELAAVLSTLSIKHDALSLLVRKRLGITTEEFDDVMYTVQDEYMGMLSDSGWVVEPGDLVRVEFYLQTSKEGEELVLERGGSITIPAVGSTPPTVNAEVDQALLGKSVGSLVVANLNGYKGVSQDLPIYLKVVRISRYVGGAE